MDFYAIFLNPIRMRRRTEALADAIREVVISDQSQSFRQSVTASIVDESLDGIGKAQVRIGAPGVFSERPRKGGDIKERLLASSKAKVGKDGSHYLHVPMKNGFRTASRKGEPWMVKPSDGLRRIEKALRLMPELVAYSRRMTTYGEGIV